MNCSVLIKPSSTTILKYQIETKQLSSTIDQEYMSYDSNMFFSYVVTSVNPVHNAQVCYFNNVWLMFLVF